MLTLLQGLVNTLVNLIINIDYYTNPTLKAHADWLRANDTEYWEAFTFFTDIFNKDEDQYSTTITGKSIKDLKIIKNEMYISFHNEVRKDCYNTSIFL